MKLSKARAVVWACMAAVVVFGFMAALSIHWVFFVLIGLALAAEITFFAAFIRCPHCGKHLDRTGMRSDITHCPFCGENIDENDETENS